MRNVARCEKAMGDLEFTWHLIETTAKMICPVEAKNILPTMSATREEFARLEQRLVAVLARENLNKIVLDIASRAQIVVDIIVRNLYERTADVGFLATDTEIRRYISGGGLSREAIEARLSEYIAKYSVYDEILILSPQGEVLAQLDRSRALARSADPLIAQTLAAGSYVETFRGSDLRPGVQRALIYSRRIEGDDGAALGVLCLCFRFEDEMAGIFRELRRPQDRSVMLLLDSDGGVIASSDEDHVPLGKRLEVAPEQPFDILDLGGREYVAKTCVTAGYQGYRGPGWLGHVMIPVEAAFREPARGEAGAAAGESSRTMQTADLLVEELRDVTGQADSINRSLRRVVWNGQVMSGGGQGDLVRLKAVLQRVSETGENMRRVFSDAMHNLSSTVLSSSLQDLQSVSRLMVDIMDRNLYERANDCRWWALTPELAAVLAGGRVSEEQAQRMTAILEYINGLYTVYARLFVHDAGGRIVAATDLHHNLPPAVGQVLPQSTLAQVMRLESTRDYCVSPFAPSPLYGDRPTYIYHAAIRHPEEPQRIVGGIGIVFDSEHEFRAMLGGALPARAGIWAAFCNRQGGVISCTQGEPAPGERLALEPEVAALAAGAGHAAIVSLGGRPHLLGATVSAGYREFKKQDGYVNDVLGVVLLPLTVPGETAAAEPARKALEFESSARAGKGEEYAVVALGERYLAIAARHVLEAAELTRLQSFGAGNGQVVGILPYTSAEGRLNYVPVVSANDFLGLPPQPNRGYIIVMQSAHGLLGLLVDDLHQVVEFDGQDIWRLPELMTPRYPWIARLINVGSQGDTLVAIEPDGMYQMLRERIKADLADLEKRLHADAAPAEAAIAA
ncbi:MAG: cache domain-containing protein [Nevskia sp.]|nr:cache domain-containing protein [Nevskia sp.]